MVDGQHKLSRRALLGAVCASPLVRHPELVSGSGSPPLDGVTSWTLKRVQGDVEGQGPSDPSCAVTNWDRALTRFNQAQAVLDAAVSEPDEDVYDALLDSHSEALAALPAPDLPALAAKSCPERSRRIDAIVPNQAWELTGSEGCLERLRQDDRRLAATTA